MLLLDSFKSHHAEDVIKFLSSKNTQVHVIPPRTTSFLQPLDVLKFAIFNSNMKSKWYQWQSSGPREFTSSGIRKRPSWEQILKFISESMNAISENSIFNSFKLSGITNNFDVLSHVDTLNQCFPK